MSEIVQLNANITGRLADIFQDVPFVPSIGNNDVLLYRSVFKVRCIRAYNPYFVGVAS